MKTNRFLSLGIALAMIAICLTACSNRDFTNVGTRVDALDDAAWSASKWISAADAPIITDHHIDRAPDGASWFVTTIKNEKKVASA